MKPLKNLLSIVSERILSEREEAAVKALKAAMERVEAANEALDDLKKSIDDGSFKAPSPNQGVVWTTCG